jgi:hypothetical protein
MRATARNWSDAKAIGRNEVIELRNVDGQIRIARKARYHDDWDPPIESYAVYDPGTVHTKLSKRHRLGCGQRLQTVIDYSVSALAAT